MKKILWLIIAFVFLSLNQVQALELNNYSDDAKIISALQVLENIGSGDVFKRLDESATKIMFYDLTLMSFSYAKHYAVSTTDENGNNYILINESFRNSPTQAIACLIAHESVHQLPHATLAEEVKATTIEAQTWIKLGNPINSDDNLVKRENKLALMYKSSTSRDNLIQASIENNTFYQKQLAMK